MTRPTTYLLMSAVAITILGSGCGLEESYIPEPTKSTATEPIETAPDPLAVVKSTDRSSPDGYLPEDNPAPNEVVDATQPDTPDESSDDMPDARDNDVRRPSPPPTKRHGPQTAEASRRLLARLGGRAKVDLTSGKVVVVWLNRTNIDDFDLQLLQNLSDLQVLNLTGTRVTDKGLGHLYGLKKLRRLYSQGTRITAEGLRSLEARLPELRVMVIRPDLAKQ